MSTRVLAKSVVFPSYLMTLNESLTKKVPILFISLVGTTLEYFEYAIYGFLAPVLAHHFFPDGDPVTSLVKMFGVFAVGSLSKPIGALIFGYLGDTKGRSLTLRYSLIGMSIPTFIVGLLPGYDVLGWGAVLILVMCRMLQGVFMIAESDGVRIYVFEHFGHKRPCLISASISCCIFLGIALASIAASQVPTDGEAWRWIFLGSGAISLLIFMLRRHLTETPAFLKLQQNPVPYTPLKNIVRDRWPSFIRTILIFGAIGSFYHFYFIFQGTYLSTILERSSPEHTAKFSLYLILLYVLMLPFAGWVSDNWGYVKVGTIGGILTLGFSFTNFLLLIDELFYPFIMILTTLSMVFFVAPAYLFLTQQYDVHIRFRSLSFGHAVGSTLFSGTNPVICLFLWQMTGLTCVPFLYFFLLLTMGVLAFTWKSRDNAYNAWFL